MALIVKIGADLRNFDKEMKKLTRDVTTIGDKLKTVGTNLTLALTAPLAAVGAASIKVGAEFEAAMSKVVAVSGATTSEFQELEAMARNLGATTKFSASQAAEGMQFLAMAGFDAKEIMAAMPGMLDLAAAGALELGTAADITSNIMSGFGIEASKSGHVADVLAKASASANTNVEQLGAAMKYLAPMSKSLGWSLEESTSAVMALSDAGIQGEMAGAAFATSLGRLASPTKEASKSMKDLNLDFFTAEGQMKSLPDVIKALEEGTKDLTDEQKVAHLTTLFGAEAFKHWAVLLDKGSGALDTNATALVNADGAAKEMAKTMSDNLAGRFQEFKSALEEIGITIFNILQPALENILSSFQGLANWFNNLSPAAQTIVVVLGAVTAAIGPLLVVAGFLIVAIGQISAAMVALNISLGLVGIVIGALIAAIAAIVVVILYWDEIKAYTIQIWNAIAAFLSGAWDSISSKVNEVWKVISTYVISVWNNISSTTSSVWNKISGALSTVFNAIKTAVTLYFNFYFTIIKTVWEGISSATYAVWNFIKDYLIAIWTALKVLLTPAFNAMKDVIVSVWNTVKSVTNTVWSAISLALSTVWNVIKLAASTVFNAIFTVIKGIWNSVQTTSSSVWGAISTAVSNVWTSLKVSANVIWTGIKDMIAGPVDTIKSTVTSSFETMKSIALGAWEGLKNGIKSVINGIISMVNKFIDGFNTPAKLLNTLPGVEAPLIPNIPMLATGGNLYGNGKAIVGEAGPELIQKSGSSVKVTPLSPGEKARGIGGAIGGTSGGTVNNINITSTRPLSESEIAREFEYTSRRLALGVTF